VLPEVGQVGEGPGQVSPERAKELAAICALNAIAAVKLVIGDLDRVEQVVKVVGFVASDPSFTGQPGVVNGASELFGAVFGAAGVHARSAVGVAALPLGAPVEVEVIVHVRD
jgi:enamine deaminase RidA (YjgF/YER057c/UK114 family)